MAREASKIMRQEPIPPGRYWVVIPMSEIDWWEALQKKNGKALQVDYKESWQRDPNNLWEGQDSFYIFFVTAPLSWPKNLNVGRPNTAPKWITKKSDIAAQRPEDPRRHPIQTVTDEAKQWWDEAVVPGWDFTWKAALILGGLYALTQFNRRN